MAFSGINALRSHLYQHFPGQIDPLTIPRWGLPHWMGGNEAIDCIFVYSESHPDLGDYWHFVTAGLSDLYGDGRVNFPIYEDQDLSGFGIELTMMVRKQTQQIPIWPSTILHRLAKYIFESGNRILPGDNIPFGSPIEEKSSLRHFVAIEDHVVKSMKPRLGLVKFVQLVGLADSEWHATNNWSGSQFTELLMETDKSLIVIDSLRGETIFDLHPELIKEIQKRSDEGGSDSACVSAKCSWDFDDVRDPDGIHRRVALLKFTHRTYGLFQKALNMRLKYKRHFTIKMNEDYAISFVPEGCSILTVDENRPVAVLGKSLQVFLSTLQVEHMRSCLATPVCSSEKIDLSSDGIIIEIVDDI